MDRDPHEQPRNQVKTILVADQRQMDTIVERDNEVLLGENGQHQHVWRTRYVAFDHRYECASGMACACGATLDQDDVEELVAAASGSRGQGEGPARDVTAQTETGTVDDEAVTLTRCVCGREWLDWQGPILSIYSDSPASCPQCGRRFYFRNTVRVYEVTG